MTLKSIPPAILAEITRLYGVSSSDLSPLSTGNSLMPVYEYAHAGRACILKVIPPNPEIDLTGLHSILDWMAFLAQNRGPVVSPVRSQPGNLVEVRNVEGREWIAVSFEKAPGLLAEKLPVEEWSDELFRQLGRVVGCCHRLAVGYVPARGISPRPQWQAGDNCFHPISELADAEPVIREKYTHWLKVIQALPRDAENYGLAHLDLHLANFLVDRERKEFTFIDFDDCGYGWYVMDIAMLLFDVLVVYDSLDPKKLGDRFLRSFLAGYRTEKTIAPSWVEQIPAILKLLEIGVYLESNPPYNPETAGEWGRKYMPGRLERILDEVPYVELDFAALSRQAECG
jgi:amicoumacin kinase